MERLLQILPAGVMLAAVPAYSSLIMWLPLDEGSGTVAGDMSNQGADMTLTGNSAFLGSGQFGGSLQIGNAGSLIARAGGSSSSTITYLNGQSGNKISISYWLKPNNENQGSSFLYVNDNAGAVGTRIFNVHHEWTNGLLYWDATWGDGSDQRLSGDGGVGTDMLHHYVLTFDGDSGAMQIYKDGGLLHSNTQSPQASLPWASIQNMEIGAQSHASYWGGGQLDDFAIFDHVLTPAEVTTASTLGIQALAVPEPSSALLAALGLLALLCRRAR